MDTGLKVAKEVILDKLESQIDTAGAHLLTLKARAETAKADAEIKGIAELLNKKHMIQQKLLEMKKSGGKEQAKTDLEKLVADFEKSVKGIESKVKAH